jgi:hypothetical protein
MTNLLGELLLGLVRMLVVDLLGSIATRLCAWLDTKIHGRTVRLVTGLSLGAAAYFVFPILMGLF